MIKDTKTTILFITLFFCIIACENPGEETSKADMSQTADISLFEHDHTFMISELSRIHDTTNPKDYLTRNKEKLVQLRQDLDSANEEDALYQSYVFAQELLHAGETQASIQFLDALIRKIQKSPSEYNKEAKRFYDLLALAYLRYGEVQNCINNHNEYSCILPLQKEGWHLDKTGSQAAIQVLQLILDNHPEDVQSKWLLNIAYMTLGLYPKDVPAEYLIEIPEGKPFERFFDIATGVGVGVDGISGGVCADDFNNDGHIDIICSSYGTTDQIRYLENNGNGSFIDKTNASGLEGITGGLNCIHADYDNDGWVDVLVLRGAWFGKVGKYPNSLLKNVGNGQFRDVTKSAGILRYAPTQTAIWRDFNVDGHLDLFVGNENELCELWINNANGTFQDKTKEYNIITSGFVKGVASSDINDDGYPDLYISVMGKPNIMLKNEGGSSFSYFGRQSNTTLPTHSFPTWFFDVDQDGDEDLFVCSYNYENQNGVGAEFVEELAGVTTKAPSKLFTNNGEGRFSDNTKTLNLDKSLYGMGSNFGDLDNDGYPDMYIGTGSPPFQSLVPNRMFRNVGGKYFEDISYSGGFAHIQKGHGVAFADFDKDGDQDIYAVMGGAFDGDNFSNVLFENPGFENNWINLQLEGTTSNRDAIGAKIQIDTDTGTFFHWVNTGGSFGSNSLDCEIGLGSSTIVKKITITWPDKERNMSEYENIEINSFYQITQNRRKPTQLNSVSVPFNSQAQKHHHHHH